MVWLGCLQPLKNMLKSYRGCLDVSIIYDLMPGIKIWYANPIYAGPAPSGADSFLQTGIYKYAVPFGKFQNLLKGCEIIGREFAN